MQTVYVETSIARYLRSRAASHVVAAARQFLTRRWWDEERNSYDLVISQYVLDEASKGNPTLAAERSKHLEGIPLLEIVPEIQEIADAILAQAILPAKAEFDCTSFCRCSVLSCGLPVNMELYAHRQRSNSAAHSGNPSASRLSVADGLHPGRNGGR